MKSGLKYEVGICIHTGDIVWINGPFPCSIHDVIVFRKALKSHLDDGERVEADDGYIGEAPQYVKCPKCFTNPAENEAMQQRVRNRQETVNKRFKDWSILKQVFRNKQKIQLHGYVFRAIAVITQTAINNGERLFDVDYDDDDNSL